MNNLFKTIQDMEPKSFFTLLNEKFTQLDFDTKNEYFSKSYTETRTFDGKKHSQDSVVFSIGNPPKKTVIVSPVPGYVKVTDKMLAFDFPSTESFRWRISEKDPKTNERTNTRYTVSKTMLWDKGPAYRSSLPSYSADFDMVSNYVFPRKKPEYVLSPDLGELSNIQKNANIVLFRDMVFTQDKKTGKFVEDPEYPTVVDKTQSGLFEINGQKIVDLPNTTFSRVSNVSGTVNYKHSDTEIYTAPVELFKYIGLPK